MKYGNLYPTKDDHKDEMILIICWTKKAVKTKKGEEFAQIIVLRNNVKRV